MQFQLPQFIEVEDTIFGPLTFKQFLYLAGGAGICFILYVYLPIYIAVFPIAAIAALSAALTFYKYNGRDFIYLVESASKFVLSGKLYLWRQTPHKKEESLEIVKKVPATPEGIAIPKLSVSKLRDLTWSLDVQGNPEEKMAPEEIEQ